jgi:hypothetical protein
MRSFVVLLRGARRPDHPADLAISGESSRHDAQKALGIESVGLRPLAPLVARMLVGSTT